MPTLNVPYGYLTKKPGELKYQFFVVVPTSSGKNVDFSASPGSNGATTTINIVISDNGNVTNERQASVYNLDLTAGNTLAGDTTIEVKTEIVNQQSYTSTWSYSDADDRDTITGLALDSPYTVLIREANETTQRHPKVLIPSLNFGYDPLLSTGEIPTDNAAATQISQIALQALAIPRAVPEWLEPSKIAGYVYFAPRDPEQITDNHYFEARITGPNQQVMAAPPKSRLKSRRYVQQEGLSLLQLIWGFLSRPFVSSRRA